MNGGAAGVSSNPWKIGIAFRLREPVRWASHRPVPPNANCPLVEPSEASPRKYKPEQRVIVEHSVRRADHGLAVAFRVPGQPNARLEVVLVGLNSLLQSEELVADRSEAGRGLNFGGISTS